MRRRAPRQAVDRAAKIYVGGSEPLPCRIRDVSEGGAKLQVWGTGCLPSSFDLADVFSRTRSTVQVVWLGASGGRRALCRSGVMAGGASHDRVWPPAELTFTTR